MSREAVKLVAYVRALLKMPPSSLRVGKMEGARRRSSRSWSGMDARAHQDRVCGS